LPQTQFGDYMLRFHSRDGELDVLSHQRFARD
jgi:hypothetical protein